MRRAIKVILAIILTILMVSAFATGVYLVAEWVFVKNFQKIESVAFSSVKLC